MGSTNQDVTTLLIEEVERYVERLEQSYVSSEINLISLLLCEIGGRELGQEGTPRVLEVVAIPELTVAIVPSGQPETGSRNIV